MYDCGSSCYKMMNSYGRGPRKSDLYKQPMMQYDPYRANGAPLMPFESCNHYRNRAAGMEK